ncbi:1516_t:CDS:2 [Cetraspora pellucida]|uniref:1516_t:CDS:1 n=1 Tax=Cetraspora pellucida TaxID=1433469 RepID=A0ACA9M4B4_9GLOM|nr:1516_t:CDS:2 [Cetraspora pellucida]
MSKMRLRSQGSNNEMHQDVINLEQKVSELEQVIAEHEQTIIRLKEEEELDAKKQPKEFNWKDVKNDYDRADNKKKFIQDLETWLHKKPATVAKERGCSIDEVSLMRGKSNQIDSLIEWFRSENDNENRDDDSCSIVEQ